MIIKLFAVLEIDVASANVNNLFTKFYEVLWVNVFAILCDKSWIKFRIKRLNLSYLVWKTLDSSHLLCDKPAIH